MLLHQGGGGGWGYCSQPTGRETLIVFAFAPLNLCIIYIFIVIYFNEVWLILELSFLKIRASGNDTIQYYSNHMLTSE